MKTVKLFIVGLVLLISSSIHAQLSLSVNLGLPPLWVNSECSNVDYYYLPDIETYYDIKASQFICFDGGKWMRGRYLPSKYRNYDLYNGRKVVLNNYYGSRPYSHFKNHKTKYHKKNGNGKGNNKYGNNKNQNRKY